MIEKYIKKTLLAMLAVSLGVTPVYGSVCAMPCAAQADAVAGADSCCCKLPGLAAEASISAPSCCSPEYRDLGSRPMASERLAGDGKSFVKPLTAVPETIHPAAVHQAAEQPGLPEHSRIARSSPIFLLNTSLLI